MKAFVFNGECYNYRDLIAQLDEPPHSSGDTEVVFKLLIKYGPDILSKLNGMYALALWNDLENQLLLARDRFGQKPIYTVRVKDLFIFASEVRSILASGLVPRKINMGIIPNYLRFGFISGPETIIKGVSLFPSASYQWAGSSRAEKSHIKTWSIGNATSNFDTKLLRDKFNAASKRHQISDVPIGLFLSGGIDSSALAVAMAQENSSRRIVTISVVFPDNAAFSEKPFADEISSQIGFEHIEIEMTGSDMLSGIHKSLAAMDQPTMDGMNTWIISHAAKNAGIKVAITGLGGDELFGGYPSFGDIPQILQWLPLIRGMRCISPLVHKMANPYHRRSSKVWDLMHSVNTVLDLYLVRKQLFSSQFISKLIPEFADSDDILEFLPDSAVKELSDFLELSDLGQIIRGFELSHFMRDCLLKDCDVFGMSASIEIRVPFLDTEFSDVALGMRLPCQEDQDFPKQCFVKCFGSLLPDKIVKRPKQGFTLPFEKWLSEDLREECESGLRQLPKRLQCFNPQVLEELLVHFRRNPKRVGAFRPWSLFVLSDYMERNDLSA